MAQPNSPDDMLPKHTKLVQLGVNYKQSVQLNILMCFTESNNLQSTEEPR